MTSLAFRTHLLPVVLAFLMNVPWKFSAADEPTSDTSAPQSHWITIAEKTGDTFRLVEFPIDGGEVRVLTTHRNPVSQPTWSPDGRQLAVVTFEDGPGQIYLLNADSPRLTNITNSQIFDYYPAWSPDGKKIAFTSNRDGDQEIYVMNSDGTGLVNLTNNDEFDGDPTWSPDGKQIAYAARQNDQPVQLFVMNADGSEQRPLSDRILRGYLFPDWSPNGKWIVVSEYSSQQVALLLFNVEDRSFIEIARTPGTNSFARWSPDGRYLAFAHFDQLPARYTPGDTITPDMVNGDLMLYDGDTTALKKIASGAVPAWAPRVAWRPQIKVSK